MSRTWKSICVAGTPSDASGTIGDAQPTPDQLTWTSARSRILEAQDDLLVIASSPRTCDDATWMQRATDAFARQATSAVGVIVFEASPRPSSAWSILPPRLAVLVSPPDDSVLYLFDRQQKAIQGIIADAPTWWQAAVAFSTQGLVDPLDQFSPLPTFEPVTSAAASARLPLLVPRGIDSDAAWLDDAIQAMSDDQLVAEVDSPPDLIALKSGLLQVHDALDVSHALSQSVEGEGHHAAGDYWHAIMHRREGDFGNSQYWFRRVGQHPIFAELSQCAALHFADPQFADSTDASVDPWRTSLGDGGSGEGGKWNPSAFVDFCQQVHTDEDSPAAMIARRIQQDEMHLLLRQTYADATGESLSRTN